MFTSCKLDMGQSLIQLDVSVEIVWVETFFPPEDLYAGILDRFDEFDRVWLGMSASIMMTKQHASRSWN